MQFSSPVMESQLECRWKRAKNITGKYYKDIVLEKPKNIIRNGALSMVLNISVVHMAMSLLMPPK